jgi:predicted ATPase/DNA-binding CsgD family transcriptional regulator/Tfp pilus assembly protein PilF
MEAYNLPQYTTPLIGREAEIIDIGDRLNNPRCRLLTLVGPGGIGKTRLATEAASVQAPSFKDGVIFVSLQSVVLIDNIVRTIGTAIGYEFSGGGEPELQLQQYLREKDQLLILDNLEHLLAATDMIANLLSSTSHLKLLITSRESLNLQEEWLYHVEGLPFPEQEPGSDIEIYDAVRLFAERARRVQRDFSLDKEQAPVVQICQLVQGIPLGIELAANWCRRLPCTEIARELQNSLDILKTDLRDVPDRHRSMRAVFDQSWGLLTDEERRVFMALSIFSGGFRRDAAKQVVGATLAALMSLVDKSMIRVSRSGRYEIHELLRHYAAERLGESPEQETKVRDQHSAYYTRFINRPVNAFVGAGNRETLKAVDAEIDNIRLAWNWAVAYRQVRNLKQALDGLHWYAWMRSWHEEGQRAFREAVAALRGAEPTAENLITLSHALSLQGAMDIWLGRPAQGSIRAQESVNILRPLGAKGELAEALNTQGWAALDQQDWQRAKALIEEAVIYYKEADRSDQNEVKAFAFGQLGQIAKVEGDYEAGEYWYQQALHLGWEIRDQRTIADALVSQGRLSLWQGLYYRARQLCEESLVVARTAEIVPFIIGALNSLGDIARALGRLDEAREHFEESLSIAKDDGKGPGIVGSLIHLADVMVDQGDYATAQEYFQQALEIPPGKADRVRYAAVRAGLGRIALLSGEYAQARKHYEASLALHREMSDRLGIIRNLVSLGAMALAQGDNRQSNDFYLESLKGAVEEGSPPILLRVLNGIADLFMKQGNLTDAVLLAALVAHHPASDAESRGLARAVLNSPEAILFVAKPGAGMREADERDLKKLSAQFIERLRSYSTQPLIEDLSERELEILYLVAAGRSNREIAQELFLAVGTVKTHLHNILQKLDASSRTQAVARARELKLL